MLESNNQTKMAFSEWTQYLLFPISMKKKMFFAIATAFFAVATVFNMNALQGGVLAIFRWMPLR